MTKKNLSLLVVVLAAILATAACGSDGLTGPSPVTTPTPTPVAQKMTVTITVNGVPVADGSTIHLAGDSTNHTDVCAVLNFPNAQGQYQGKLILWNGFDGVIMGTAVPVIQIGEKRVCTQAWNGATGSEGPVTADFTWFKADDSTDHQVITIHVVFD